MLGAARHVLAAACVALVAACNPIPVEEAGPKDRPKISESQTLPVGVGFDFYVLSLSWSPSFCEAEGDDAPEQQCGKGRPYAFIVHGLWPQFERGWPENCLTADADVDGKLMASLTDLMPSYALIRHQWRKHGSCSGLSEEEYFTVLRAARERVALPPQYDRLSKAASVAPAALESEFVEHNPGLKGDGIAVTCDRRHVREVRICMTKQLEFRSCPEVDERGCRLSKAIMPPVRGG